jgi:hypothetical protein
VNLKNSSFSSLDDFLLKAQKEAEEKGLREAILHKGNGDVTKSRAVETINIISREPHSLCFEIHQYRASKKAKTRINAFGEEIDIISDEPEVLSETPLQYTLAWIIDLGSGNFRKYHYWAQDRTIQKEDKEHIIELFKYMEDQIKNVPS